ncbi:proline--tRNA ligase [Actinomycetota bacterium]|nr:proline--tRNA ligase [Actinomycetota bacterium]
MLKLSQLFTKTLRDDPADAEVASHKLLVRAGYIRQVGPGIFTWLPLGLKVLQKIEAIADQEMQAIGAQKVHFPALIPREPYEKTNRWTEYGPNIFRLQDRKQADYLLAPTHEEMFTLLAKDMLNSYKDLPVALYQIQTKYRDEARPRAGLLRGREFIMKDAYSFDLDADGLNESYQLQRSAYKKIFERLGLEYKIVQAQSGAMGGSNSEEFLSPTPIGEDTFVIAPSGYAANVEAAKIKVPADLLDDEIAKLPALQNKNTPNAKTIDEVSKFLGTKPEQMLKAVYLTLIHPVQNKKARDKTSKREVVLFYVPGDREIDVKRVESTFPTCEIEQTTPSDLENYPELVAGFVGPDSERKVREYFDELVFKGSSWVVGGNEVDVHSVNCVAGRDFETSNVLGLVQIREGDQAFDGSGAFEISRGVEIGHIFALGDKYSKAFDFKVLDQNGKAVTPLMGSYGIGVTRALALLAQNYCDEKGLAWPKSVAPAVVHIVVASKEDSAYDNALKFASTLETNGVEVLLDDRKSTSPGVKFKDAELLGVPYIAVFGRGLDADTPAIEFKERDGSNVQDLPLSKAAQTVLEVVKS